MLNDLHDNKHPADTQRLECAYVGHMATWRDQDKSFGANIH